MQQDWRADAPRRAGPREEGARGSAYLRSSTSASLSSSSRYKCLATKVSTAAEAIAVVGGVPGGPLFPGALALPAGPVIQGAQGSCHFRFRLREDGGGRGLLGPVGHLGAPGVRVQPQHLGTVGARRR